MKVKDVMNSHADVINCERTVREAAQMMASGNYGSIPVEKNDKMIGMITDRDITIRVVAEGLDPGATKVEQCMSAGINYCFEEDDISVVARKLISKKIRRIPVVNKDKRLVGMLSVSDIANKAQNKNLTHDLVSSLSH